MAEASSSCTLPTLGILPNTSQNVTGQAGVVLLYQRQFEGGHALRLHESRRPGDGLGGNSLDVQLTNVFPLGKYGLG
jgi:hypothetical protein